MSTNSINMVFQPLTPFWTGNVDRSSIIARETSIIGNLRWWYEALIRGLGGKACSPVETEGNGACSYDSEKGVESICPACRLFGCSGWSRRFRLTASGFKEEPLFFYATNRGYSATGNWLWRVFGGKDTGGRKYGKGRDTTFRFGVHQLWGQNAKLQFNTLFPLANETLAQLAYLCHIVSNYGGFGAKQQHGFGQMQWLNNKPDKELLEKGRRSIRRFAEISKEYDYHDPGDMAPNFSNFFSIQFLLPRRTFQNGWREVGETPPGFKDKMPYVPCAFSLRYKTSFQGNGLRTYLSTFLTSNDLNTLMGISGEDIPDEKRSASRIFVSHPFRDEVAKYNVRVYGFFPPLEGEGVSKRFLTDKIQACFTEELFPKCLRVKKTTWREIQHEKL